MMELNTREKKQLESVCVGICLYFILILMLIAIFK
jgi:hypothetical protein